MASWGNCDFEQLKKLQQKLNKLQGDNIDLFLEDCSKELAARLLAKVIKRTPVGQYKAGEVGGTLRRGWTASSEREAELSAAFGGANGAKAYVESLHIEKSGNMYQIEIINPVHYGIYVEFGHRTSSHTGWVNGRFMLTVSEQELEGQSPRILENKLMKYLGGIFND